MSTTGEHENQVHISQWSVLPFWRGQIKIWLEKREIRSLAAVLWNICMSPVPLCRSSCLSQWASLQAYGPNCTDYFAELGVRNYKATCFIIAKSLTYPSLVQRSSPSQQGPSVTISLTPCFNEIQFHSLLSSVFILYLYIDRKKNVFYLKKVSHKYVENWRAPAYIAIQHFIIVLLIVLHYLPSIPKEQLKPVSL